MKARDLSIIAVLVISIVAVAAIYVDALARPPPRDERPPAAAMAAPVLESSNRLNFTLNAISHDTSMDNLRCAIQVNGSDYGPVTYLGGSLPHNIATANGTVYQIEVIDRNGDGMFDAGDTIMIESAAAFPPGTYQLRLIHVPSGSVICERSILV